MTKINKEGWEIKSFEKIVMKLPKAKQVKTDAYNSGSKYPIISQEETYISGYCDDESMLFRIDRPVVIFGDHTRVLKYVDFDFVVGADGVKIIMPIEELDAKLLYYYLKWYNVPSLGYSRHYKLLKELNIPLPPLPIQQRIVEELDEINAIISAKKLQLSKLDELAQSIFYNMFGDPVANEKGWEVKMLVDISTRFSDGPFGSNLKSEHYQESGVRIIRLQNIGVNAFVDKDKAYISEEHYQTLKKFSCYPGDIVIGTLGEPNLRACILPEYIPLYINKADCVLCRVNEKLAKTVFVSALLNTPAFLEGVKLLAHGQTRSRISSGQLKQANVILPPLPLQETFAARVSAIEEEKAAIAVSIEKMQTLLDARMQEYFG